MEKIFRLDPTISSLNDIVRAENVSCDFTTSASNEFHNPVENLFQFEAADHCIQVTGSNMYDIIKTQIANHPRYPDLLSAHIEFQKVGAPPEMASVLEEISRENFRINTRSTEMGVDPQLDEFMESYCKMLQTYKEELSKPFNEATTFLSNIESQLSSLCEGALSINYDDGSGEASGTSDDEFSGVEVEASESQESSGGGSRLGDDDQDLKGMLMRKYSGYLSNIRKEFMKKRKKGVLPKDARLALLDWWNNHRQWPYPTEEEKGRLSEMTGLDQKQINNWFINQRKRHWKPSEDVRLALMEGVGLGDTSGIGKPSSTYFVAGGENI